MAKHAFRDLAVHEHDEAFVELLSKPESGTCRTGT